MRRRQGPRKPGRKFESYTYEDGTKWEIRFDPGNRDFFCCDEDCHVRGKTPDECKRALKAWLDENRAITWEPIIVVQIGDRTFSRGPLGLDYDRLFRGKKADGKVIYRKWELTKEQRVRASEEDICRDDILDVGAVGHQGHADEHTGSIIPYAPGAWKTLRTLEAAIREIRRRLEEFVRGPGQEYDVTGEAFLEQRSEALAKNLESVQLKLQRLALPDPDRAAPGTVIEAVLAGSKKKKRKK